MIRTSGQKQIYGRGNRAAIWIGLLLSLVLVLVLAACSSERSATEPGAGEQREPIAAPEGGKQPQEPSGKQLAQQIAAQQKTLAISYRSSGGTAALFESRFAEPIRQKFPSYTIQYVPVVSGETPLYASRLAGGEPYDISIETMALTQKNVIDLGLASDISDLIKKYDFDLSQVHPMTLDVQRQFFANGGIYGLPWTMEQIVLVYNRELFNRFGVEYPRDGMTWDEMYDLARRLTREDGGVQYKGITIDLGNYFPYNQLSAPLIDGTTFKARVTDDAFRRVFEMLVKIESIPGSWPTGRYSYSIPALEKEQRTAMWVGTPGIVKRAAENWPSWDVASLPTFPERPGVGSQPMPAYTYITSLSKERDAAFQIVAFLASAEYQEWYARVAAFLPALSQPEQAMAQFGKEIQGFTDQKVQSLIPPEYAPSVAPTSFTAIAQSQLVTAVNKHFAGTDINTVLREAAEAIDEAIARELAAR